MAKHTVAQVPGAVRKSDRIYSHAIIGRYDNAQELANIEQTIKNERKHWKNDFEYFSTCLSVGAGLGYPGYRFTIDQEMVNKSKDMLDKYGYELEAHLAARADALRKEYATKYAGTAGLQVLQWSMSQANASKALGKWAQYYTDLQVVEVHRS